MTEPEWSIARIKPERLCTVVQNKHTVMVTINPTLFSLTKIPLSWKEHIFHSGSFPISDSILEVGLWAGGSSLRSTRRLVSSHLCIHKIRHRDSGRSIGLDEFMNQEWCWTSKAIDQMLIVVKRAQDANYVFDQSCSDEIIL